MVMKAYRWFPKGAELRDYPEAGLQIGIADKDVRPWVVGYYGKAAKHSFNYVFKSLERAEAFIAEKVAGGKATLEFRAKQKAERLAAPRGLEVGDILMSMWGYDQTNVDYYQVVELVGKTKVLIREIAQEVEETAWLQGKCVPKPGVWATEADYSEEGKKFHAENGYYPRKAKAPMLKVAKNGSVRIASYASASKIDPVAKFGNKPVYGASHWTAYA